MHLQAVSRIPVRCLRAFGYFGMAVVVVLFLTPPSPAGAASIEGTMGLCRNAAIRAADKHGVPRNVLTAITLVETRTKRAGLSGPWPWTVNVAGKGNWFDSRAAALLHAQRALARGQTSFDVGCFQLNYRWHARHFKSLDHMFEPGPSGDYAARFLKSLYAETGDWIRASGLYHSRTKKHSTRYRNLVAKAVKAMGGRVPKTVTVAAAEPQAPPPNRIFRRDGGALIPIKPSGAIRTPRAGSVGAGGVGLVILRRGAGGLLRVANKQVGQGG